MDPTLPSQIANIVEALFNNQHISSDVTRIGYPQSHQLAYSNIQQLLQTLFEVSGDDVSFKLKYKNEFTKESDTETDISGSISLNSRKRIILRDLSYLHPIPTDVSNTPIGFIPEQMIYPYFPEMYRFELSIVHKNPTKNDFDPIKGMNYFSFLDIVAQSVELPLGGINSIGINFMISGLPINISMLTKDKNVEREIKKSIERYLSEEKKHDLDKQRTRNDSISEGRYINPLLEQSVESVVSAERRCIGFSFNSRLEITNNYRRRIYFKRNINYSEQKPSIETKIFIGNYTPEDLLLFKELLTQYMLPPTQ